METVAVLDFGKTNIKLLAIGSDGRILESLSTANRGLPPPPYLHVDLRLINGWLLAALRDLGRRHAIAAIVPTAHGSSGVLVDERGPTLPMMDYEAEPPPEIRAAYAEVAPPYGECFCPTGPGAQRPGLQLLWQQMDWPDRFERARHLLMLPQYWSWKLSGVPASELTAVGAQTHLWNPRARAFSSLVERQGWRHLFPPFVPAWRPLGPLRPEVARATGLPADTPVLCGIHDSNANYFRYLAAGMRDFALLSTGTWIVGFNPSLPLERLDESRWMTGNTDLDGRPVASNLVMGGREFALVAGERPAPATPADVAWVIGAGTMALPAFTDSDGPFPGSAGRGRIEGPPPADGPARTALATLYTALIAAACIDLLEAPETVVIDGGFAGDPLFGRLVAGLRPDRRVLVNASRDGTALGAALLWRREERTAPAAVRLELERAAPAGLPGLEAYAERWRRRVAEAS
ncbi:MAG TPA: FGGY family carbohydrate kinase [Geminicoccaceae bacterium]|nr:FGGY family carbohydrate kinase [Geminicoccaceae bacterium]